MVKDDSSKTDDQWKALLTPQQYHVTREKGTEAAFTGKYHDFKGDGIYRCVSCNNPLFSSNTKYDSGTGWPSYRVPISDKSVELVADADGFRTEVLCQQCGAHLGHIFDDGPAPTGKRYCMNSVALDFKAK